MRSRIAIEIEYLFYELIEKQPTNNDSVDKTKFNTENTNYCQTKYIQ